MEDVKTAGVATAEKEEILGLSSAEAAAEAARGNANVSNEKVGKSYARICFENLFTFFNLVWAIVAIVLISIGSYNNLTFLFIIIPNVLIAIIQEIRAKRTVDRCKPIVWDVLDEVIKDHPVLLNRAPTLHRLSIQAFEPVLIEGRALKLHPLVCGAFNADFDGDQMAIHVPLSIEAQAEARFLMLSSNNILKLSDGKPVMSPSQDMVLGSYYLTIDNKKHVDPAVDPEGYHAPLFISENEVMMAYNTQQITLQDEIFVRRTVTTPNGETVTGTVKTTAGRIIFNRIVPQDLGFVKRETPEDYLQYEVNFTVKKKNLSQIVDRCFKKRGAKAAADVLDDIKALGFRYSTVGALSTSVFDMKMPAHKQEIISGAEKEVLDIEKMFKRV